MLNSTITNLINLAFEVSYNYDLGSSSGTGSLGGLFLMSGILSLVTIVSQWKVFTKAGKPGWASIVPVYNMIVMIQIADLSLVYLLLFFVPIANIYALFKIYIGIAHKFGKSTGFGVGLIFLTIIFMPMLAFGDAVYEGNSNTSMNNDFNNNNNNFNNNNNNFNNQMNNNGQTMGFDPQTGQPIVGYDPQTGQPIYGNQNQMQQTNTFVNNNMNQPTTSTFVNNDMNQPTTNTFVDNNMNQPESNTFINDSMNQPANTFVDNNMVNNEPVNMMNNQVTEPIQNTFVAPTEPTAPASPATPTTNNTMSGIDRPDATPVNDINNQ